MAGERPDERILILAPLGRDAALACETLDAAGVSACACADIEAMCEEAERGVGALLLTQEAFSSAMLERLREFLQAQPPWSDLPLLVLVSGGRHPTALEKISAALDGDANPSIIERPVRASTLVEAARSALRARRRQYDLREHLRARHEAEEAQRDARALAEEAVRIRDDFLATVAHDLKNPLGAIKGVSQLLQRRARRGTVDHEALPGQLAEVEEMANRAIRQIDELLDLARLQAGQPLQLAQAPVDLALLVHRTVSRYQLNRVRHELVVETPEDPLLTLGDAVRLERVLENLLGNAMSYSDEGTCITVRVRREDGDPGWGLIAVEDAGIGIPASELPRVFERFFRSTNVGERNGTGLGLASARQIVEQHGGTIDVDSVEGAGTTFTVRLPLHAPDAGDA